MDYKTQQLIEWVTDEQEKATKQGEQYTEEKEYNSASREYTRALAFNEVLMQINKINLTALVSEQTHIQ